MNSSEPIASPVSTGGGGTFFEQHVDALFLALLLVRGIPPILKDCQVEEVHLQTQHLGWHTDDVLIVGSRSGSEQRKLAIQVKLKFTVSDKNDDCRKAIADYWADFKNNEIFDPQHDRLALVVQRASKVLLDSFNGLLDCARASADGADFAQRISPSGYLSNVARNYAEVIRKIIHVIEGSPVPDDDLWRFLSILHVVAYDLNTSTAANEASIKTMLEMATHESDPVSAAESTWNELLEIVSKGMPFAKSFIHSNLPDALTARHGPQGHGPALQALAAHSKTTLDDIKTTIAHAVSIPRNNLTAELLECLDKHQIAVVTGPAGLGKSVVAKSAIEALMNDHLCFVFRAEEFSEPHIDTTLQHFHASINGQWLRSCLAAQGRIVILVESVERLLEASVRDAFSHFLDLAKSTQNIQIILTCRDYSVEMVRTALLDRADLPHSVMEVPPLTDDDLAEAALALPILTTALGNPRLKELLRSPYLLDIAARMDWSDSADFPGNEREFRLKCWNEVVRNNAVTGGGLPRRREVAFQELATRRARALTPYVPIADLDAEAIDALNKDSLVSFSRETDSLAAPSHDVMEDWAIIQWLDERFYLHQQDPQAVADAIAGCPAIRRGYRKWLGEILEIKPAQADSFVLSTLGDQSLPAHFRDDTLVSTLLSSSARGFLTRHRQSLIEDDAQLFIRIIHLLRVACKTVPSWLAGANTVPSQFLVATGEAWSAVLEIASEELESLLPAKLGILMGFVEDWAISIEWTTPEPPGFNEAGNIAFGLLAHMDGYQFKDMRKRLFKVIVKIPKSNEKAFEDLLRRGHSLDRSDHEATDLAEILLTELESTFACRDFPEQMVKLSMAQFCLTDDDLSRHWQFHAFHDIEPFFGIRPGELTEFFPPSAIRGPFFQLLRFHPGIGVRFIVSLMNHAAFWYAEQRWPEFRLEPVEEITVEIPGDGEITQWANARLWGLYRGTTVGPYVIQSALMALERWLLNVCELEGVDVEAWLLKLLRDSNNVAVTAVVASVCTAFPEKGGRAALAVLTSRELINVDRARMVGDLSKSRVSDLWPYHNAVAGICGDERKKSDLLPHRQQDLEALALKLQLGGFREEVWQILDRHRDALPPVEEQSEDHRLWRLALHRMDIRGFRPRGPEADSEVSAGTHEEELGRERRVYIGPGVIEEDIQQIVDHSSQVQASLGEDLALVIWAKGIWDRDESGTIDVNAWRDMLAKARVRHREPRESEIFSRGGPTFVAAVCVRDHWEELSPEDRAWCTARLVEEIERESDSDDYQVQISRMEFLSPDRPAAYVLPKILSKGSPTVGDPENVMAIAKALTHASTEVSEYAAEGIGQYMQGDWGPFALRCTGALARQSRRIEELRESEKRNPIDKRLRGDELVRMVMAEVRDCIALSDLDVESELAQLNPVEWPGSAATLKILQILGFHTDLALAKQFYGRIAIAIVQQWDEEGEGRRRRSERNYDFENKCLMGLARFALRLSVDDAIALCEPLLESVNTYPGDTANFLESLVLQEDLSDNETSFWGIWQEFAERLCQAPWVTHLNSRWPPEIKLVNIMFLGPNWKEDVRHWRRLDGQASRVDALVGKLPSAAPVLQAYCRFLYKIGERSLPSGFVIIQERLDAGNPSELLADDNIVFYLEALLRRSVYGEPHRLKSDTNVRSTVLDILDQLIEAGSSAAYRMRDDFVTPLPPQI